MAVAGSASRHRRLETAAQTRHHLGVRSSWTVGPASLTDPELAELLLALWGELDGLYGPNPGTEFRPADLDAPGFEVLLARNPEGVAVGCGVLAPWIRPEALEVRRMYVRPEVRGRGVSTALLRGLEAAARARGVGWLRLETGVRQPAAIRLYAREGFVRATCWPPYDADPLSVCFEKRLEPSEDL